MWSSPAEQCKDAFFHEIRFELIVNESLIFPKSILVVVSQQGQSCPQVHSSHRALGVWPWVGTIMRQLEGPGISPPMKARLAAECAEAIEQMKKIKTFATLQLPFMCAPQLIDS